MAAKVLPDQAYLRECFDYRPDIGLLVWRTRPENHFPSSRTAKMWNKRFPGKVAGKPHKDERAVISLNNRYRKAARIIWKWHHDSDPPEIDHRNNDHTDDRIENLRAATQSENIRNRRMHRDNKTGFKGIKRLRKSSRFVARIYVNGKTRHLGCFATAAEASAAYLVAARLHFGEFANGG